MDRQGIRLSSIDAPCKGCADRFVGCHGVCEKFAQYNELKKAEYAQRYLRNLETADREDATRGERIEKWQRRNKTKR